MDINVVEVGFPSIIELHLDDGCVIRTTVHPGDAKRASMRLQGVYLAAGPVPARRVPMRPAQLGRPWKLSARQREVLALLVDGRAPKEVASLLFISVHTARNHVKAILKAASVHSTAELVAAYHKAAA